MGAALGSVQVRQVSALVQVAQSPVQAAQEVEVFRGEVPQYPLLHEHRPPETVEGRELLALQVRQAVEFVQVAHSLLQAVHEEALVSGATPQ